MAKTSVIYSGLFLLLSTGLAAQETAPSFKTSDATISFFNAGIKECKSEAFSNSYAIESFKASVSSSGSEQKQFWVKESDIVLGRLNCKNDFINELRKRRINENLDFYRYKAQGMVAAVKDFDKRGLTSGGPAQEYLEIIKASGDEKLQLNPEIDRILESQKDKVDERRKTCGNTINIKAPLDLDKPKHQDSIGWCYAFTASELIAHATGKDVSAAYGAILFNNKILPRMFKWKEGGYIASAANEIIENGVCLEKDLQSNDYRFSMLDTDANKVYDSIIQLNREFTSTKPVFGSDKKAEHNKERKYSKWDVQVSLCTENVALLPGIGTMFPHLNLDQLIEALMSTKPNILKQLAKTCPIQDVPELKNLTMETDGNIKTLYKTMDDQLDKGNIVGIEYVAQVLTEGYKKGDKLIANHASSIVGRRFNEATKSCEYLLRNSWGTSCKTYSEEYECKDGSAWVNENYFKYENAIHKVAYVEKK